MTVMLTGALASDWAAFRPPKPAPTITTRCAGLPSILLLILFSPIRFLLIVFSLIAFLVIAFLPIAFLPIKLLLYKIQRDDNRLHKFAREEFGCGLASDVVAVGRPVSGRFDLRGARWRAGVHCAIGAVVGRCRDRLAHSHWADNSGDACDSASRSIFLRFLGDARPAVVCLGVAVRRDRRLAGEYGGIERRSAVYRFGDCDRVCMDLPDAAAAGNERIRGDSSVIAGGVGGDDPFSGATARSDLVIHDGVVLDSGVVG